jgi:hypothetical protein
MNAGPDVERLISTWLVEEAPERAPDRILGAAGTTIDRTKQRRFAAWREPMLVSTSRLVAAAAIVIAAVVGAGLIGRSTAGAGDRPSASAPPTTAPLASPSFSPAPSNGGSVTGAIPEGTYASAPMQVADIIALMNADTTLTREQRTHLTDVALEIKDHTTFSVSIELKGGKFTQRQSVDGSEQVGSRGTYAFLDSTTLALRDAAGLGGFLVTPVPNGFRLKALTPAADAEEAFAGKLLFESSPFMLVP